MKKSKIVLPVLTGACLASSIIPLASCGCGSESNDIKEAKKLAIETIEEYSAEILKMQPEVSDEFETLKAYSRRSIAACKNVEQIEAVTAFARAEMVTVARHPDFLERGVKDAHSDLDDLIHKFDDYRFAPSAMLLTTRVASLSINPSSDVYYTELVDKGIKGIEKSSNKIQARGIAEAYCGVMYSTQRNPAVYGGGDLDEPIKNILGWINDESTDISACFGGGWIFIILHTLSQSRSDGRG